MKRKTNKRILYVLIAAIVLSILSAAGIYLFLAPQRTTVYVFREDYTVGTQVTKEQLMPIEVDATIIEMGKAADISEQYVTAEEYTEVLKNAGVLRYDITKGTALMKSMLTGYGGSKVEMSMKPSSIAMTVPSNYLSAVTNELESGAYVNVYASYENGQTALILQNIRVLTAPKVDGVLSGVTLEVDHEQSLKLAHALSYGEIVFGLVNGQGYQYTIEDQPSYDAGGFIVGAETASGDSVEVPAEPGEEKKETKPEEETQPETETPASEAAQPEAAQPEVDSQPAQNPGE